jgi:hypothetical protein
MNFMLAKCFSLHIGRVGAPMKKGFWSNVSVLYAGDVDEFMREKCLHSIGREKEGQNGGGGGSEGRRGRGGIGAEGGGIIEIEQET